MRWLFWSLYTDLVINNQILIELKTKPFITKENEKQFWRYLKFSNYKLGFLINFGSKKLEIKRRIYDKARDNISVNPLLKSNNQRESASTDKGFTLIELLIVIAIMSILAAIMFGSQFSIREQSLLFQDYYRITDYINQAKNFTLGAFMRDSTLCGYGVSFQKPTAGTTGGTIILYKDVKENPETNCNSDQHFHEYNPSPIGFDEIVKDGNGKNIAFELNKTEQLIFEGTKIDIVFNAPSLTAFLTRNGSSIDTINVILRALKSEQDLIININQFGQVSAE